MQKKRKTGRLFLKPWFSGGCTDKWQIKVINKTKCKVCCYEPPEQLHSLEFSRKAIPKPKNAMAQSEIWKSSATHPNL